MLEAALPLGLGFLMLVIGLTSGNSEGSLIGLVAFVIGGILLWLGLIKVTDAIIIDVQGITAKKKTYLYEHIKEMGIKDPRSGRNYSTVAGAAVADMGLQSLYIVYETKELLLLADMEPPVAKKAYSEFKAALKRHKTINSWRHIPRKETEQGAQIDLFKDTA